MIHEPVLLTAVIDMVAEMNAVEGIFVDATFGRGGHTRALLDRFPSLTVVAVDADDEAIEYGRGEFAEHVGSGRLELHHANYVELKSVLNGRQAIGVLADLGVSSPQLDKGPRGFSFYHDGPLDMRMDRRQELTAADIINTWSEDDLVDIFRRYGEVRKPFRAAKRIVESRERQPIRTTGELAAILEKCEGWGRRGHHPATNYFLALRLAVNQELEKVEEAVPLMVDMLRPGGRAFVITFHSLEDRIVKYIFKGLAAEGAGRLVNKKVIQADREEVQRNPRARSAKLRVFERGVT